MTRLAIHVAAVAFMFAAACTDDGGGGGGGGGGEGESLQLRPDYYPGNCLKAFSDANGGAKSFVNPTVLSASGGSPFDNYTFSTTTGTALPAPGLMVDPLTGVLHGTIPSGFAEGSHLVDVTVTDGSKTASNKFDLSVVGCDSSTDPTGCDAPAITELATVDQSNVVHAAKSYGANFRVCGGKPPYAFTKSGDFPPGLTMSGTSGVVAGDALSTAAGQSFTVVVTVTDANGTAKDLMAKYNVE